MATIFAGTAPPKVSARDIIAGAQTAIQGFRTASDIYQQAEDLIRQKQKDQLAKLALAADLSGGYHNLPPAAKDKIPSLLGVDLPRGEDGRVQINEQLDDFIKRSVLERAQADPEFARSAGSIAMGLMDKAPNPEALAADLQETLLDAQGRLAVEGAKDRRAELDRLSREAIAKLGADSRLRAASIRSRSSSSKDAYGNLAVDASGNLSLWNPNNPDQQRLTFREAEEILGLKTANSLIDARVATKAAADQRRQLIELQISNIPLDVQDKVTKVLERAGKIKNKSDRDIVLNGAAYLLEPYLSEAGITVEESARFLGVFGGDTQFKKALKKFQEVRRLKGLEEISPASPRPGVPVPRELPTSAIRDAVSFFTAGTISPSKSTMDNPGIRFDREAGGIKYRYTE